MISSVPMMIARGRLRCGSLTSPLGERQIGEAVVRPQHADQRQAEAPGIDRPRRSRRSGERSAVAAAEQQRRDARARQRAELRDRRDADDGRADLDADDVGGGGEDDGAGREKSRPVGMRGRIDADDRRKYSPKTTEMPPSAEARISTSCAQPKRKPAGRPQPSRRYA